MNFEVLKKSHLKRNIIIGVVAVTIISAVVLNFTRAKYRTTQSIPLVNGTINYIPYDFNMMAMYQENEDGEYEEIEIMPNNGYVINEEMSYCTVDSNRDDNASLYTNDNGEHVVANLQKGSRCYLYFDIYSGVLLQEAILANASTRLTRSNFNTVVTSETSNTIYYEDTVNGITYYFVGNPTDNWVSFAGFYWRIIRINEDGTIRMIYSGTSSTESSSIGTSAFNDESRDNMYVGYMYTSGSVHGLGTNSTIKGVLDDWYYDNLRNYADSIDGNAGFCGDRVPSTSESESNGSGGTGSTRTYYGAYVRLNSNKEPTFECNNDNDLYTVNGSSDGNGALQYPIGLITADEVAYAGGGAGMANSEYYLNTGQNYWTMSPAYFRTDGYASVFNVNLNGAFNYSLVFNTSGVFPVINLKADVTISSGDGTSSNPYTVS